MDADKFTQYLYEWASFKGDSFMTEAKIVESLAEIASYTKSQGEQLSANKPSKETYLHFQWRLCKNLFIDQYAESANAGDFVIACLAALCLDELQNLEPRG
ncbi:uncharacterized protein E0L32_009244 [Thyridium curvatum]|uniref:Uncharacterized protein n=1 Tax=Thyridium curvatum TaxID=1093900 RepID=A0A507AX54_9PEZI|nr:uncharacterized protein E0L32_009244 [Thyridium curvatum]TPX09501.1 hypothetical protein E0L32_009244 [Thyridium curvatum]